MQEKSSTTAVVSMVLGILSIVSFFVLGGVCFGLPALGVGVFALVQINGSGGALKGKGPAMAGVIMGGVGLLMSIGLIIFAAISMPVLEKAREKARRVNCAGNLKQLGLGMLMYTGDNKGYMPPDLATLVDEDLLAAGRVYQCPSAKPGFFNPDEPRVDTHFVYIGSGLKDDNESAWLVPVAHDQLDNHPNGRWVNVLFLDGHVEGANPEGMTFEELCSSKGWIYPTPGEAGAAGDANFDAGGFMELLEGLGAGGDAKPSAKPKPEGDTSHLDGMDIDF